MSNINAYIEISEMGTSPSGKTRIWAIRNVKDDVEIGIVRWAGNWRKYVYEQEGSIYYDWDCLRLIADFIEEKTLEHYGKVPSG